MHHLKLSFKTLPSLQAAGVSVLAASSLAVLVHCPMFVMFCGV